jgi:2-amino-4-hydroxy-6-hydroxymethyldihydropteridine diphosphokinase
VKGRYLIALGSNVRHCRHGPPERVIEAACAAIEAAPKVSVKSVSPIVRSAPLGHSRRRYANAAAIVRSKLEPPEMLAFLQAIEHDFGRRRTGRRWRERVIDLDIVLWNRGMWHSPELIVPHPEFRDRAFVLAPAVAIAPDWRDPLTGLTPRHLLARLTRPRRTTR